MNVVYTFVIILSNKTWGNVSVVELFTPDVLSGIVRQQYSASILFFLFCFYSCRAEKRLVMGFILRYV